MDVKSALNSILPATTRTRDPLKAENRIKSANASDRDANGQEAYQQQKKKDEHPNRPMSEGELEKALAHLKSLPVVTNHGLTVAVSVSGNKKFILISEPSGKVVRRIQESELWSLIQAKAEDKGQLLRKAA
ncbi:MAG: hypothetical protein AB7O96_09690 [Pseudobdellovibrionaceae bacterium]